MRLVWHSPRIRVRKWLLSLIGDLIDSEIEDYEDRDFSSDSIHVVSINRKPLNAYRPYFEELRATASNITLFHTGDEWLSGGYRHYRLFDRVIRNYRTPLARCEGVFTLPLGFPNTSTGEDRPLAASRREYSWSFAGQIKASRAAMVAGMRAVPGFRLVNTACPTEPKLAGGAYNALLGRSVFSPCPMGNVNMETWRLYESLEQGAIPLIERRPLLDYHADLFGPNPIPTFADWAGAARWCRDLARDPAALDAKQAEIRAWWRETKYGVGRDLRGFLAAPSRAPALAGFAARPVQAWNAAYQPARVAELLRHQSAASLRWRLGKTIARRGPAPAPAPRLDAPFTAR